jgi:hypothetical protein
MNSIHINPKHKGMLHEAMGIAKDKKIPGSKLAKVKVRAKKSGNVKLEREAVFAQNAKKWKH